MRHRNTGRKLGRTTAHRSAMLRNMVTSLFHHERIETTETRAKELRRLADKMVTLAKRGDLHARRQALSVIRSKSVTHKLFTDIRERFLSRNGGYTRLVKIGFRKGDGSPMSIIELVADETAKGGKLKKSKKTIEKKKDKAAAPQPEKKSEEKKAAPESSAPAETSAE